MKEVEGVPIIPWAEFKRSVFQWKQGQHVTLLGPTGDGKTTLALNILDMRQYVAVLATKPRDATLDKLVKVGGFKRYESWPRGSCARSPRRLIWPRSCRDLDLSEELSEVYDEAMSHIYKEGGWCLYLDEAYLLAKNFRLERKIRLMLTQCRALNVSIVGASQRPAFIPLEFLDQASHAFIWPDTDETNIKRSEGMVPYGRREYRAILEAMPRWHALYTSRDGRRITCIVSPPVTPSLIKR